MTEQEITQAADLYIGHPQEIDEDVDVYATREAYKDDNGKTYIIFSDGRRNVRLTDGDAVTYDDKSGQWNVELTTDSHKFNSRFPYTTHID